MFNAKIQLAALASVFTIAAGAAAATTLQITVTNNQAEGGLAITPLYTALHDGAFDAFDLGGIASPGIELIAETGMAGTIAGERQVIDDDSIGLVLASPSGPPPIQPGESVTETLNVTTDQALFFTFLSMVLPSNDHFIGNDNPLAYQIFGDNGEFLGNQIINVTGQQIYDAGTEANGLEGVAFVQGQDINLSPAGEGRIQQGIPLSPELDGVTLIPGGVFAGGIDFTSSPADFNFLTITITEEVAPVPLPASAMMLVAGMGLLGWTARRRRA